MHDKDKIFAIHLWFGFPSFFEYVKGETQASSIVSLAFYARTRLYFLFAIDHAPSRASIDAFDHEMLIIVSLMMVSLVSGSKSYGQPYNAIISSDPYNHHRSSTHVSTQHAVIIRSNQPPSSMHLPNYLPTYITQHINSP